MRKADEILRTIEEDKKKIEFLPTGFSGLDKELDGGFLKKEIVVLGAFTGIGKSILAGQIMYTIASQGFSCAYFSLEISNEMILSRLVGQEANIKPARILNGLLNINEYDAKARAKAKVTAFNEFMDFYDDIYLLTDLEKIIREKKYEFVVIDFVQNILLENGMEEYARLSFVAVKLQKLAKEVGCCILLLSQLSNKVGTNNQKVVEYKGSGAIAMVADLGFFLERGEPKLDINGQPVGDQPVTLNLRKNRRGMSGLCWDMKFINPGGKIL